MFKKIIAGPCAVESYEQMDEVSRFLSGEGIEYLRGGAYKPRSSPYSFQGLEKKGLDILYEMKAKYKLKIVTELLDWDTWEEFYGVDMIQIGARNMHNYALLRKVGKNFKDKEILLKRGLSATISELISSAEYIRKEGHTNIVLCERGVRRIGDELRNILDISIVPYIKQSTDYEIIVDPSHATGRKSMIIPLCKAAKAVDADGIIVEVHPNPQKALCDSAQQLDFASFKLLLKELE